MSTNSASSSRETRALPSSLECAVTANATCRFTMQDANALRKQSDNLPGKLGNSLLRHCDEQTLVSLAAVRDAAASLEPSNTDFGQWGVVFSSRYLGRSAFADALVKFAAEGPWNVSVQVVPNRSLHSPASMIGLAMGCHGPCVGVGGGLDGECEAWLTAVSLLEQHSLPGMWLMFSGWEPDNEIDQEGNPISDTRCTSVAIALQPATAGSLSPRLQIGFDPAAPTELPIPAPATAIALFDRFTRSGSDLAEMAVNLGGGLRATIRKSPATVETIPLPTVLTPGQKKAA